jgi:hypothetical protein
MSNHSDMDIRENLSAFLDGELTTEQAEQVQTALAGDDTLRTELDELRRTRELLTNLPRRQAPDDFVQRVLSEAERKRLMTREQPAEHTTSPGRHAWVRYVASAAVVLIVASVGVLVTANLWNASDFYSGHRDDLPDTSAGNRTVEKTDDTQPSAPESLGWAPELVVISPDIEQTTRDVEASLASAGLVPLDKAHDAEEQPPLYEWITRDGGRRELAVYYRDAQQRQAVEDRLAAIRARQSVAQVDRWARPVQLHVRRESLAGRDFARFTRRSDESAGSLGHFLHEHWAHPALPLAGMEGREDLAAFDRSPFREKTPEEEAADLIRNSMRELRKEHGLDDSGLATEGDGDEPTRIDRILRDSLAQLHRRPVPTSRPATNAAMSAEMKLMLISIVSDAEARRLADEAE